MFQSKKPKLLGDVRHLCKFRLRTDASRDTRCSRALNRQLPRVIEGLHDAVRTHTHTILYRVCILYRENNKKKQKQKNAWTFDLLQIYELKFPPSVCANILVTQL